MSSWSASSRSTIDGPAGGGDLARPVAAVVVVDVERRRRQRGSKALDRRGNRRFLVEAGQQHGDARLVLQSPCPLVALFFLGRGLGSRFLRPRLGGLFRGLGRRLVRGLALQRLGGLGRS